MQITFQLPHPDTALQNHVVGVSRKHTFFKSKRNMLVMSVQELKFINVHYYFFIQIYLPVTAY